MDPVEFAHQLTLVDYEKFCAIHPVEFVCRLWEGNSEKTRHLQSMVEWFNTISYFVATEICVQPELKKRVRLLENFIRVAIECRRIRNLNATMSIISGLNNSAVRRLRKTWLAVNPKLLESLKELETLLSDVGNFRNYREFMAALEGVRARAVGRCGGGCCVAHHSALRVRCLADVGRCQGALHPLFGSAAA